MRNVIERLQNLKTVILISTAFLAVILLYFLLPQNDVPPIKVGVVLPLSGDFETFGKVGLQGVKLAADDINSSGGLLGGQTIQLFVENNESDPNLAVRKMRKLIQEDGVSVIIGPVSSTARNAMVEVARQFKIPLLYGIDYEGGHYDRYLFCYSPVPDHVITPLVPYMAQKYGKNYYVFGYDYIWPHEMSRLISEKAEEVGGRVIRTEFTPFGVTDFSPVLERIDESGADVLFLVMCGNDGQRFVKQFSEAGLKNRIKVVALAAEESWGINLSQEVTEGIVTISHFLSSMESRQAKELTSRIKAKFGDDAIVTYSTESHYGLLHLLAKAIGDAGGIDDMERVIDMMEGLRFTVGNGEVVMREDHHMILNMTIATFRNGELVTEKVLGAISPKDQRPVTQ